MKVTPLFDLDGVLAHFVEGVFQVHNRAVVPYQDTRWDFCMQIGFDGIKDPKFWAPMGREFWAGLDVHYDGFDLLTYVESLVSKTRIGILTAPPEQDGAIDGKRDWCKKHLPYYADKQRVIYAAAKDLIASPTKLLIDDHEGNVDKWDGPSVLIPRPWNRRRDECKIDVLTGLSTGDFNGNVFREVFHKIKEIENG